MNYIYLNINYVKSTIDGYSFPFDNKAISELWFQAQIILPWEITNTLSYFILPKENGSYQIKETNSAI